MAAPALRSVEIMPEPAPVARSVLRFITCGSVDDGKSTLIGRILYEAGAVFDDHLDALDKDSARFGTNGENRDFALLVDGLAAEREQGITIDVAYRYFATPKRSFIVADTPGHEQYTRNMATGASTADLAILLIDARKGLLAQTRRHSFIVSTMGVKHVIVAINKMDLVGYDEATFRAIEAEYRAVAAGLGFRSITVLPVSAREGDNLKTLSPNMPWYRGGALLPLLESIDIAGGAGEATAFAMPVQWVNRPDGDFRGFSGTIANGRVATGDLVQALPSGKESRIARIVTADGDLDSAIAGDAVTLVLTDEIDLSRGDVLAAPNGLRAMHRPRFAQEIEARLIVTGERRIAPGETFLIKLGTAMASARIVALRHVIDIESYATKPAQAFGLNAIGTVILRFDRPLVVTDFAAGPVLGGFILIDRLSNETSAFGFVLPAKTGTAADTEAKGVLVRLLGEAASPERAAKVSYLTWRISSAIAVGGIVFAASGHAIIAGSSALADLMLRPIARRVHDDLWRRIAARRIAAELSLDGGGI